VRRSVSLVVAVLIEINCGGGAPSIDASVTDVLSSSDGSIDALLDASTLIDGPLGTPGMCDVVTQQGCGVGQSCYPPDGGFNFDSRGHCAVTGALGVGGSCQTSSDCAAGLMCETSNSGRCFQICTTSATCPMSASTCMLFAHGAFGMCS
jgi:hypothetical protein